MTTIEALFKCRKCRHLLFDSNCVQSSHGNQLEFNTDCKGYDSSLLQNCEREAQVWYLKEDLIPDWAQAALNQEDWMKGKLNCPKCDARIGSFDFISGLKCPCDAVVLPAVHLVKSKVDCEVVGKTLPFPIRTPPVNITPCVQDKSPDSIVPDGDRCVTVANSEVGHFSDSQNDFQGNISLENVNVLEERCQNTEMIELPNEEFTVENESEVTDTISDDPVQCDEVPHRPSIPHHMICAICLDMFLNPFTALPCQHVFCETCLRRLGAKDPTKTYCPLCRKRIGHCQPHYELCKLIRSDYQAQYEKRRAIESKLPMAFLPCPLPYHPHYNYHRSPFQIAGNWALGNVRDSSSDEDEDEDSDPSGNIRPRRSLGYRLGRYVNFRYIAAGLPMLIYAVFVNAILVITGLLLYMAYSLWSHRSDVLPYLKEVFNYVCSYTILNWRHGDELHVDKQAQISMANNAILVMVIVSIGLIFMRRRNMQRNN